MQINAENCGFSPCSTILGSHSPQSNNSLFLVEIYCKPSKIIVNNLKCISQYTAETNLVVINIIKWLMWTVETLKCHLTTTVIHYPDWPKIMY